MYLFEHQSVIPSLIFSFCLIMLEQDFTQEILGMRQEPITDQGSLTNGSILVDYTEHKKNTGTETIICIKN